MYISIVSRKSLSGSFMLVFVLVVAVILMFSIYLPEAIDWHNVYRPAALDILSGKSPYTITDFHNPPWTLIPFLPFAWLPENISRAIETTLTLVAVAYVSWRLGASPLGIILILLSPPVFILVYNGNIDGFIALGFVLPPQIGLFFLLAKPQVGIGVAIFWLSHILLKKGITEAIVLITPVMIATLASFVIFGNWFNAFSGKGLAWNFNASLWPYSIPIGFALIGLAWKKNDPRLAMMSAPCLSPYVLIHSWIGVLLALARSTPALLIADLCLWAIYILRGFN